MIDRRKAKASWPLLALLLVPGALLAHDGIWLGFAEPDSGAPGDCEGADLVVLVEGTEVRGGLFSFDAVADELDELVISGTIDENDAVTDGTVTDFETMTVSATFTGTFLGVSMDIDWQDTEDQNCFGTAALTQQASFVRDFDEMWIGTAAETQNLPDCPGSDPIADVTIVINDRDDVDGSIEVTEAGEAPVTFSVRGFLDSSRVLQNGAVRTAGTAIASLTGTFGAQDTTLNWDDGECTGTATLTLQTAQNTPPTASPLAFGVVAGEAFSGILPSQDPDPGTTLTHSIVTLPTKGTVEIDNASTGAFTYTADGDASGTDTFEFKVSDGTDDSNVATVTVTITPAPSDVPVGVLLLILGGGEDEPEE